MKDPLFGNKVAAAALVTALLAVGVPVVLNTVSAIAGGHHDVHGTTENPLGLAYIPAEIKTASASGAAKAPKADLGTLLAAASAERGARSAGLCKACHTFDDGGANGIGPNLWNIMGREIATVPGFGYSPALAAKEGTWTYEALDPFLKNSQAYVPGTQMAQMIRKEKKRADIMVYLASLSDEPLAFPAPIVAEEMDDAEHAPEEH